MKLKLMKILQIEVPMMTSGWVSPFNWHDDARGGGEGFLIRWNHDDIILVPLFTFYLLWTRSDQFFFFAKTKGEKMDKIFFVCWEMIVFFKVLSKFGVSRLFKELSSQHSRASKFMTFSRRNSKKLGVLERDGIAKKNFFKKFWFK